MAVTLLIAGVAGLLLGHRWIPMWVAAAVPAAIGLVTGWLEPRPAWDAVRQLDSSIAFLVAAVPLAVLLGQVGFFDAVAMRIGTGRQLGMWLWVLAGAVTTVLNLDAAIVLLTPLYIRVARRCGLEPLPLALMTVLQAALASSALHVSNLTNLIVADEFDTGTWEFVWRLGPASVLASGVGWLMFRRMLDAHPPTLELRTAEQSDRRALTVGGIAVGVLTIGFVAGEAIGLEPWLVATVVVIGLAIERRALPWRSLPVEAVLVASGLAVLASAAAPELGIDGMLRSGAVGAVASGIVGAAALNNLPVLLVGLPYLDGSAVWPFLAGVNFGPVLWLSGSLAGLLWLHIVRQENVEVSLTEYAKVGFRVGVPALLAAMPWIVLVSGR